MKYRKKPVVIEAVQWNGHNLNEIKKFVNDGSLKIDILDTAWQVGKGAPHVFMTIHTLEGDHECTKGDYIIKGVAGEFYPCKPDIFEKTYEPVVCEDNGHVEWARSELERLPKGTDGTQDLMNSTILDVINEFSNKGYSGFAADYAANILNRLFRSKPITPLTGEEDEWGEFYYGSRQNKRCTSVFQKEDGSVHDIDGIIVSDNGGVTWFASGRFRKKVEFPYLPPIEPEKVYIEYTEDVEPGFTSDKYEIITDKPERIKALYERKRKEFDEVVWEEENEM